MASRRKTRKSNSGKRKVLPRVALQSKARNHTQSPHEVMAVRIAEERYEKFIDRLSGNMSEGGFQHFYDLMEESYAMFDTMLDDLALDPPLACKRGCIYCCINQVSLTEPEALYLGFYLLKTRSQEQLADLEKRARSLLTSLKGKSREEIGMERHLHPCLFMEEGNCSIYPARPFVCRGWNSVNAEMCRHSNQAGDALAPIENHPLPRILAESILLGILNGAKKSGFETGYLLLARAAYMLLEGGAENVEGLTRNWLAGGPLFAKGMTI